MLFRSIEKIEGRDSDILVTPDGRFVIVHIFTIFFEWISSVDQFQAIQEDEYRFRILLVVNDKFNNQKKKEIEKYWSDYFGEAARVTVEVVQEIPASPSGKRQFLIRNSDILLNI